MNDKMEKLSFALEGIHEAYLEEALNFMSKRKKAVRFPRLSAACIALLVILCVSATAVAVSRIPLSWRDVFPPRQTVIGDEDEAPVTSLPTTDMKELKIDVVKAISDERVLYLLYSMRANEGAVLSPDGRFSAFAMYFPNKMMSGAYQQYFLERKAGVPENELEGVIFADWQADENAKNLILTFSNWQEKCVFSDTKVDCNLADIVSQAGENANLPMLYTGYDLQYLWQPGDTNIPLPYGGVTLCNAGWENGVLQLVMKGPKDAGDWATGRNWYFIDARTNAVVYPEQSAYFHTPDEFDENLKNADWVYFWNFVAVDKDALPYLEMHCGGQESFATVLPGEWEVHIEETPVTVQSKLLAESIKLTYQGKELSVNRAECSKLSLAVYFEDYVDPTTGILGAFNAYDIYGNPINCNWGFTADPNGDSCMVWTRFDEPIDPESVGKLTCNGDTIFQK